MVFPFLNMLTETMHIPMEINVCKMNNHIFSPQNNTIGQIRLIFLELLRSGGMCFGAKGAEKDAATERGKYSFAEMKFMSSVVFWLWGICFALLAKVYKFLITLSKSLPNITTRL
jgi:hypothetical protein